MTKLRNLSIIFFSILITSCMGVPDNVKVVDNIDANQYLGTWYEIARLDHSFERDLMNVTANYSLRDDGGIKVINRGYNPKKNAWKQAEGKAYFVDAQHPDGTYNGKLKVSFFGPFYGAYNIIELDKPYYNYVMLCGPDKSYFWILSRTPQLPYPIKQHLISKAKELGFETDKLIYVPQTAEVIDYEAGKHVTQ
jgi:apolipoprotein D and lipocalin family protein